MYRVRWADTWESEENVSELQALETFQNRGAENKKEDDKKENEDSTRLASDTSIQEDENMWTVHKIIKKRFNGRKKVRKCATTLLAELVYCVC